jgi:hypothetical protein
MKVLSAFFIAYLTCSTTVCSKETSALNHFITAGGDQLFDGSERFRFMSFNIPNLHLIEDNFSFTNPNPWRWPDEFEIADALETIRQMGGKVARI